MTERAGRVDDELSSLVRAAAKARERAYAPYSGYAVGAAIRDGEGRISCGCNVENASYPVGTCAEAGAVSAMVAAGGRRIAAVVVLAHGPRLVAPCGACRQRLAEFSDASTLVHLAGPDGVGQTLSIADLLPFAFGPGNLSPEPSR